MGVMRSSSTCLTLNKISDSIKTGHLSGIDEQLDRAVRDGVISPGAARRTALAARLLTGLIVSGEALAAQLGMSRAAVHKHVQNLRESGWSIVSLPGSGYRLDDCPPNLEPEVVLPLLLSSPGTAAGRPGFIGLPYEHQDRASSSNDLLRVRAEQGWPGGAVAVVEEQTAGRGRLGRHWQSRRGDSVTFSVLLRPGLEPARIGLFALAAAVGVAESLRAQLDLGSRVAIKWPNDVLVDGKKVCGILAEASIDMDAVHWVIVGIGVNVNGAPSRLIPQEEEIPGREGATSLEEAAGGVQWPAKVFAGLLSSLASAFRAAEEDGAGLLEQFGRFDYLRGVRVRVRRGIGGERDVIGRAAGIAEDGSLLIERPDGAVCEVAAGDAFRVE